MWTGRIRGLRSWQLNRQLERLQRELKEVAYQPLPVRRVPIPKRDKPGEYRLLGIPAIYDRVCQLGTCSVDWSPSSNRYSTTLVSDIGEGDERRMPLTKCGKRYKAGQSGSWMRISEIFSSPRTAEKLLTLVTQRVADGRVLHYHPTDAQSRKLWQGAAFSLASVAPRTGE